MPKETFLNLPTEKKALIENVAIKEFAEKGFDKASINTIVSNSNIAKGSFYQYFSNKKDIYIYLIKNVTLKRKLNYMSDVLRNPEAHDFFTLLRELIWSGLMFAKENKELYTMGSWLINNKNHELYKEIFAEAGKVSENVYGSLLQKAIERGEVREDINIPLVGHAITNLMTSVMEYRYNEYGEKMMHDIETENDYMEQTIELFIDLIKNGIEASSKK